MQARRTGYTAASRAVAWQIERSPARRENNTCLQEVMRLTRFDPELFGYLRL